MLAEVMVAPPLPLKVETKFTLVPFGTFDELAVKVTVGGTALAPATVLAQTS